MLLGELKAAFPWGVLLVTDDASSEQIPAWTSGEEQVTYARTALVVRVMHQDEGSVEVRVWSSSENVRGALAYGGTIDIASQVLRVSDGLGVQALRIPVSAGLHRVEIYTNSVQEATEVHVVLDPNVELRNARLHRIA